MMEDFLNALLFGLGWGALWGGVLALLLATSPPRRADDATEAQEAEDDNPHPAHPPTIDGTAVRL